MIQGRATRTTTSFRGPLRAVEWVALWLVLLPIGSPLGALDPERVRELSSSVIPEALEASGSPGAVLAVVEGDDVVLLEGYGVADVDTGRPVLPERTLFRLGSVTKPLVGLAVLRLVERSVLDLDAPVERYLEEVRIPETYPQPVTLRHLLTHRGGFDADLSFSARPPGSPPIDLGRIERRLDRVRAPGGPAAYDVIGFGVVGLVLEAVTGKSLRAVLEDEVFRPLGMERSTVGLPPELLSDFARCHVSLGPGRVHTCPHLELTAPFRGSGSAAATAADMVRLMRELLRAGAAGDGGPPPRLLSPAAYAHFLDFDQYRVHEAGAGLGLGIRELDRAGRRAFGHGGGIHGFDNSMEIFPEDGVGIYLGILGGPEQVYDARLSSLPALLPDRSVPVSVRAARARLEGFPTLFAETLLPPSSEWPPEPDESHPAEAEDEASDSARNLAGFYVHNRYRSDNLMVELSRLALTVEVEALGPESLRIAGRGPYRHIGPLAYEDDSGRRVLFRLGGPTGDERALAFGGDPYSTYELESAMWRPGLSVLPAVLAVPVLLTGTLYVLPAFPVLRRRAGALWAAGAFLFAASVALELEYATWWIEIQAWPLLAWLVRATLFGAVGLALAGSLASLRGGSVADSSRSAKPARFAGRWLRLSGLAHRALLHLSLLALAWCTLLWTL